MDGPWDASDYVEEEGRRRLLEYEFSDRKLHILTSLAIAESSLSFLGGCFVVFSFLFFGKLRQKFAFEQVANMALADMGACVTYWMASPRDGSALCGAQAVLQQTFEMASVLWAVVIATTLDAALRNGRESPWAKRRSLAYLFAWGTAVALAALPLATDSYGSAGAWCWIRSRPRRASAAWRFSIFYVPVWLAICYNGRIYARCGFVLRRLSTIADDAAAAALRATILRLARYPAILVACWCVPTINRFQQIAAPSRPVFALYVLTVASRSMMGLLNALAFGTTATVTNEWRAFLAAHNLWRCKAPASDADALIGAPAAASPSPPPRKSASEKTLRSSSVEMSNSVASESGAPGDLPEGAADGGESPPMTDVNLV